MNRQQRKAAEFRALHTGKAFVIPNPWDAGFARVSNPGDHLAGRIRRRHGITATTFARGAF